MNETEAPKVRVDKNGFTLRPEITDRECLLICLRNAPSGTDPKQVQKLINRLG